LIVTVLLASLGGAQDVPREADFSDAAAGYETCDPQRIARGQPKGTTVFVRIREGGLVQVKAAGEWRDVTLNDLATFLVRFADEQDEKMRKDGKSAYEKLGDVPRVPRIFVSIDAEPTVPWICVSLVMGVALENKYYKQAISDGTRTFLVFHVIRHWVSGDGDPLRNRINVIVHAVGRNEKPGNWGEKEVLRPTEVRYKFSSEPVDVRYKTDDEMEGIAPVADYVTKAKGIAETEENTVVVGQIKAGHKVPFSRILDVVEAFEKARLWRLEFYGSAIPSVEMRGQKTLPYPPKNY